MKFLKKLQQKYIVSEKELIEFDEELEKEMEYFTRLCSLVDWADLEASFDFVTKLGLQSFLNSVPELADWNQQVQKKFLRFRMKYMSEENYQKYLLSVGNFWSFVPSVVAGSLLNVLAKNNISQGNMFISPKNNLVN